MAQQYYPIDLRTAKFPMLSEQQTRTVIGSQVGKAPAEYERPHIAYCHNVMPSEYGYDAVGYVPLVPAFPTLASELTATEMKTVYSTDRTKVYLAWDSAGAVYVINELGNQWVQLSSFPTAPTDEITLGTVNGITYIMYPKQGLYTYDQDTFALVEVTTLGLDITTVLGMVASSGYLVAYTESTVAWSSTLDPLDFVPSAITGAGGGDVAGIAGDIIFAVANTLGILIYTAGNIIAATYTSNVKYPFKFREVEGSKGGISLERTADEANSASQFVYSKAGLQSVTSQRAEGIFPEATDFLAGRRFEDYDEDTKEFILTDLAIGQTMRKRLTYVASRYLVMSYGLPEGILTHALVLDTALSRLGKLKIPHVDAVDYVAEQSEISKESIGFLGADGSLNVVNFATKPEANGVIMLGKLQASHTRLFKLVEVVVENVPTDFPYEVYSKASLDGKSTANVLSTPYYDAQNIRKDYFDVGSVAKNHSLVITGAFNLVTVLVKYTINGRR